MNIVEQFDSVALAGIENLRLVASGAIDENGSAGKLKSATAALKAFDSATRRIAAQNNRITVVLKTAQAIGIKKQQLQPFWQELAGASAPVTPKTRAPLAQPKTNGKK